MEPLFVVAGMAAFAINHTGQCIFLMCVKEEARDDPVLQVRAEWISSHLTRLDGTIEHKHFIGLVGLVAPGTTEPIKKFLRGKVNAHTSLTSFLPLYRVLQVTSSVAAAADRLLHPNAVNPGTVLLLASVEPMFASDIHKLLTTVISAGII